MKIISIKRGGSGERISFGLDADLSREMFATFVNTAGFDDSLECMEFLYSSPRTFTLLGAAGAEQLSAIDRLLQKAQDKANTTQEQRNDEAEKTL